MAASAIALVATLTLSALGAALVLLTSTETTIAAGYRDGVQALHAAEAALERVSIDLRAADWAAVAAGNERGFAGGAPGAIDLAAEAAGWRLYANGWLAELLPGTSAPRVYVAVWVNEMQPGNEMLSLRAHAYVARRTRRVVDVTIGRNEAGIRRLWWSEAN